MSGSATSPVNPVRKFVLTVECQGVISSGGTTTPTAAEILADAQSGLNADTALSGVKVQVYVQKEG